MSKIAFINDEAARREASREAIVSGACARGRAPDGRGTRAALAEGSTAQITGEPFTTARVRAVVSDVLAECPAEGIEVVSATPDCGPAASASC
jgi:hypothetical protein